jgi:hypothetical protein
VIEQLREPRIISTVTSQATPIAGANAVLHCGSSIHRFMTATGTGRILNLLHLVMHGLLDVPVLYLSATRATQGGLLPGAAGGAEDEPGAWVLYAERSGRNLTRDLAKVPAFAI